MDRKSIKPYTIPPDNADEKPLHLKVGSLIWFPIFSIHRDPNYFPNPERFDPERFSEENKHNIKPFSYMPFGSGPKNCIGNSYIIA